MLPHAHYSNCNEQTDYTILQVNIKHTKRLNNVNDKTFNKTDQKYTKVIAQIISVINGLRIRLPYGINSYLVYYELKLLNSM